MRIALDTNRYSDLMRGLPEAANLVNRADRIFMPIIVLGELRAGFALGDRQEANESTLRKFLTRPRVEVLHLDDATTHQYAVLFAYLRKHGTPIPTNDIWIAALAAQHNLALYARDAHFDRLPQLLRA